MLAVSKLPASEERAAALEQVPWQAKAREILGVLNGVLRNQGVELIDIAVGTVHARAAIVALQEAADALLQSAITLVESFLAEVRYAEGEIMDPLGMGNPLTEADGRERMRKRLVRIPVEDAALQTAAAGNHLVNAHLRLAWEANAATEADVLRCGFSPRFDQRLEWASMETFRRGLEACHRDPLSILPAFGLSEPFQTYASDAAVLGARDLRDQIVHRGRPSYRESPSFKRRSVWRGGRFKVEIPTDAELDPDAPAIAERRQVVIDAGGPTLRYIDASWTLMQRWLQTVDVFVKHTPGQVAVTTHLQPGQTGPRIPRERRDPGPFLSSPIQ